MIQNQFFKKEKSIYEDQILWLIKRLTYELQEYRQMYHGRWSDDASRTINNRFLDPHEEDSSQMLDNLQSHIQDLNEIDQYIDSLNDQVEKIRALSIMLEQYLSLALVDLDQASYSYGLFQRNQYAFSDMINEALKQIQAAHSSLA